MTTEGYTEVPNGCVIHIGTGPLTAMMLNVIMQILQTEGQVLIKGGVCSDYRRDFHEIELMIIAAHEKRKERA